MSGKGGDCNAAVGEIVKKPWKIMGAKDIPNTAVATFDKVRRKKMFS